MLSQNQSIKDELANIVSEANRISAWHKYDPKETIVDELIINKVVILPAMPGDTLYEIRKVCDTNDGRKEEYKPNIEFDTPCKHFEPVSWYDEADCCNAVDKYDEGSYCDLNLNILCEECKNRFTIQKTKFEWSDMDRVVGTAMYNKDTEPYYRKYLTEEDAKKALEEIKL
jgi:hypothetical protein